MASMRDIKLRIKSVKSTQQITKAMNLVSAAKLQRARQKAEKNRPFYSATETALRDIVKANKGSLSVYLTERAEKKTSVTIVIAADRGLCGGYNTNVCRTAREFNRATPERRGLTHSYLTVGTKARDFFRRRNKPINEVYTGISEDPFYEDALKIGEKALEMYVGGETDEVWLAYTEFKSVISHKPRMMRLLPVDTSAFSQDEPAKARMIFDPDENAVLEYVAPKYVNTVIYGALCESAACQEGARMTAMDSATDNAGEMIESYSRQFNRARQGAITQEITEIVSGANALE